MRQACKTVWECKVDLPVDIQIQLRASVLVECLQQTAVFQFVKQNTGTSTELRISFQSKQKEGGRWRLCRFRPTKVCLAWRIYRNQRWSFWSAMTRKRHHDYHFEEKNTQVTAEDDVVIKVGFAGLCGTDLHIVSVCLCFWTQHSNNNIRRS